MMFRGNGLPMVPSALDGRGEDRVSGSPSPHGNRTTGDRFMKRGDCCKYRAQLLAVIAASGVALAINAWVVMRLAG